MKNKFINDQPVKTFRIPENRRKIITILFSVCSLGAIGAAIWVVMDTVIYDLKIILNGSVLIMIMCVFIYGIISINKHKFEIFSDRIVETGAIITKQLLIKDIIGFMTTYKDSCEVIVFKTMNKKLKLKLIYQNNEELINWVNQNFTNLDVS